MTARKKLVRARKSRAKSGSVLVEFALLAPVFFMLIMGLVEFVLYQYKIYALNHVVYEASRNLQTGEIRTAGNNSAAFLAELCAHSDMLIDCNEIDYDVAAYEELGDIEYHEPEFDEDGHATNFNFEPGKSNDYSVVRASIPHSFVTPFMNQLVGLGPENPAIVNSYCIVRNEPWN